MYVSKTAVITRATAEIKDILFCLANKDRTANMARPIYFKSEVLKVSLIFLPFLNMNGYLMLTDTISMSSLQKD